MSKDKLIQYYEKRLQTVIAMWESDSIRGQDYIDNAKEHLEAVKNGREW